MLVYVRDSCKEAVLSEVTIEDIPEALQDRFTEEKRIEAIKKTEKSEAHLYIRLNVILEKEFYKNYLVNFIVCYC